MRREALFERDLVKEIKRRLPGCMVLKLDPFDTQGIPDRLILWEDRWAMLEVKREEPSPDDYRPNQEHYLHKANEMSFAATIYPENEKEVLDALQQSFGLVGSTRHP